MRFVIYFGTIFSSLRMLVGAFSAAYLLSKGMSLVDLAFLKTFQAMVILASDIPLAYIADRYSRKLSIVLSVFSGGIWLVVTGIGGEKWVYYGAEFFNAISISLLSGAFIAYLIDLAKAAEKPVHKIIGLYKKNSFFGMAIASVLGAIFADILSPSLIWLVGGFLCLLLVFTGSFLPKDLQSKDEEHNSGINVKKLFFTIIKDSEILKGVVLMLVIGIYYQVLIQYWQPVSQSALNYITDKTYALGLLFGLILMSQSLAGKIASIVLEINKLYRIGLYFLSLSFITLLLSSYYIPFLIISIVIMYSGINIITTVSQSFFHNKMESFVRATADSIVSTILRVMLMVVMPLFSYLTVHFGWIILNYFLGITIAGAIMIYFLRSFNSVK